MELDEPDFNYQQIEILVHRTMRNIGLLEVLKGVRFQP